MAAAKAEAASEMDLLSNCMMHSFLGLRLVGKCSCVAHPPTPGRRWNGQCCATVAEVTCRRPGGPRWTRRQVGRNARRAIVLPGRGRCRATGSGNPVGIELAGDAERR